MPVLAPVTAVPVPVPVLVPVLVPMLALLLQFLSPPYGTRQRRAHRPRCRNLPGDSAAI